MQPFCPSSHESRGNVHLPVSHTTQNTQPKAPTAEELSHEEAPLSPRIRSNPADENLDLFQKHDLLTDRGSVNGEKKVPEQLPALNPSCISALEGLLKKPGTCFGRKGKTHNTTLEDFLYILAVESKNPLRNITINNAEIAGEGLPPLLERTGYFHEAMNSLEVKPHNILDTESNENHGQTQKFEILISVNGPNTNSLWSLLAAIEAKFDLDIKIEKLSFKEEEREYFSLTFKTETGEVFTIKVIEGPDLDPFYQSDLFDQSGPLRISIKDNTPHSSCSHNWQPIFDYYTKTPCFFPRKNYFRLMHDYTTGSRHMDPTFCANITESFHLQMEAAKDRGQYIIDGLIKYIMKSEITDQTTAYLLTYQTCCSANLNDAESRKLWTGVMRPFNPEFHYVKYDENSNDFLTLVAHLIIDHFVPFSAINSIVGLAGYINLYTTHSKRFELIGSGMHLNLPACPGKLLLPIRPQNAIENLRKQSYCLYSILQDSNNETAWSLEDLEAKAGTMEIKVGPLGAKLWSLYDMLIPSTPVAHSSELPTIQQLKEHKLCIADLKLLPKQLSHATLPLLRHLEISLACIYSAQTEDPQSVCDLLWKAPYSFASKFSYGSLEFLAMNLDNMLPQNESSLSLTEKLKSQKEEAFSNESIGRLIIESFCETNVQKAHILWKMYVCKLKLLPQVPNEVIDAGPIVFESLIKRGEISSAIAFLSFCQQKQYLTKEKHLELLTQLCETCISSPLTNEFNMNLLSLGEMVFSLLSSHKETKSQEETSLLKDLMEKLVERICKSDIDGPAPIKLIKKIQKVYPDLEIFISKLNSIDNAIKEEHYPEAWATLEELIFYKEWSQDKREELRKRAHTIINLALVKEINPPQETNKKKKKGASNFNSVNLRETTEFVLRINKGVSSLEPKKPSLEMRAKLLGSLHDRLESGTSHQTVDRMYHEITRQTVQLARDLLDNGMKVPPVLRRRCESAHYPLLNYYKQGELPQEAVPCILSLSKIVRPTHWNPGILEIRLWAAKEILMQDPITSQNAEDAAQIIDLAENTKKLSNHLHQTEQAAIYCRLALHFLRENEEEKGLSWLDRLLSLKREKGFLSSINYNDLLELATLCYEKGNDVDKTIMLLQLLKEIPPDPSSEGPTNLIVKLAKNKPQQNLIFFGYMLVEYHTVLKTSKEYEAIRENAKYVLTTLLNGKLKNTTTYFNILISLLTTFEITEGHLWKSTLRKANNPDKKREAWTSWKTSEENNLVQYQSSQEHLECWSQAVQILKEMRHTGIFYVLDKLEEINSLEGEDNQALVSKIREKLLLGCLGLFQGNKTPPSLTGQRLESLISLRDSFPSTNNVELPLLKALSESCNPYYLGICCNRLLSVFKDEDSSTIHSHLATLTPELISRISKVEGKPSPELEAQAVSVSEQARETLKMSHNDCIMCAESLLEMSTAEATLGSTLWIQKSLDFYKIPEQQKGSKRKGQKKNDPHIIFRNKVDHLFNKLISQAEQGGAHSCLITCLDHPNAPAILTHNQYSALWGRIIENQMKYAIANKECSKEDMVATHKLFCDHFDSFKNKPELYKKLFPLDIELNIEIFLHHEDNLEGMKERHIESYSLLDFTPAEVQSQNLTKFDKEELNNDTAFKHLADLPFLGADKYMVAIKERKATANSTTLSTRVPRETEPVQEQGADQHKKNTKKRKRITTTAEPTDETSEKETMLFEWTHYVLFSLIIPSFSTSASLPVFIKHSFEALEKFCELKPYDHRESQYSLLLEAIEFLQKNYDSESSKPQKKQFSFHITQLSSTIHRLIPTLKEEVEEQHTGKLLNNLYSCLLHGIRHKLFHPPKISSDLFKQFSLAYQAIDNSESQIDLFCDSGQSLRENYDLKSSEQQKRQFTSLIKHLSSSTHQLIPYLLNDVEDNHIVRLIKNLYLCIEHGMQQNLLQPNTFLNLFDEFTFAYLAQDEERFNLHLDQARHLLELGDEKGFFAKLNQIYTPTTLNRDLFLYYKAALYLSFPIEDLPENQKIPVANVLVVLIEEKGGIQNPFVLKPIINLLGEDHKNLLENVEVELPDCYETVLSTIMKSPLDSDIGFLIDPLLRNLRKLLEADSTISPDTKRQLVNLLINKTLDYCLKDFGAYTPKYERQKEIFGVAIRLLSPSVHEKLFINHFDEFLEILKKADILLQYHNDCFPESSSLFDSNSQEVLPPDEQKQRAHKVHEWFDQLYNFVDNRTKLTVLMVQVEISKKTKVYINNNDLMDEVTEKLKQVTPQLSYEQD